jgi:uncharacterized protein (DUF305 family)
VRSTLARRLGAISVAAILAAVLVGCSSDDMGGMDMGDDQSSSDQSSTSNGEAASHNDADVTFATDMIPHHAQAVEMANLVDGKDVDPAVQQLAADIQAAQGPEIETMTGWLEEWGAAVPESMEGMDMSGDMPGMMSPDDMAALAAADGADFQMMWLTMMIEHHQGAIEMAQTEQSDGEYAPAVELAGQIESAQTAEIAQMEDLLAGS